MLGLGPQFPQAWGSPEWEVSAECPHPTIICLPIVLRLLKPDFPPQEKVPLGRSHVVPGFR